MNTPFCRRRIENSTLTEFVGGRRYSTPETGILYGKLKSTVTIRHKRYIILDRVVGVLAKQGTRHGVELVLQLQITVSFG